MSYLKFRLNCSLKETVLLIFHSLAKKENHTKSREKTASCPKCHSKEYCKNGKDYDRRQYKCTSCDHNFTINRLSHGVDSYHVRLCLQLCLEGLGFRSIERIVGVSHVSVINWVRRYGKALKPFVDKGENPSIKAVEVDELHSYIGSKKTSYGYGLLWKERVKGCWVLP